MNFTKLLILNFSPGTRLLISNVERATFPTSFDNLIERQFTFDENGIRRVAIGDKSVECHKSFKLMLSMSLPLTFRGTYLCQLFFYVLQLHQNFNSFFILH